MRKAKPFMQKMLRSLEEKINPIHTALLVVDMQNDFCDSTGSLAKMGVDISHMASIVPAVERLTRIAENAGVLKVYMRVIDTETPAISAAYYEANLSYYEPYMKEDDVDDSNVPWMDASFGEAFYPAIEPKEDDVVITKHRFGAFANTKLDQVLRSNDIKTVIIVGVMTDVCVESTARAALDYDYYVVVAEDCTATSDEKRKRASLDAIGTYFGIVTTSKEIIETWQGN